jgi:hypothetical protein
MSICKFCNKEFIQKSKSKTRVFCSVSCANKSRRKIFEKECPMCHSKFLPPRNHGNQKYCSKHCRDVAKVKKMVCQCDVCGTKVEKKLSRVFEHNFCSKKCNNEWRRLNSPRGQKHHQFVERESTSCKHCGKPVFRLKSQIRKYVFCSTHCWDEWQKTSGYIRGERSPTWRGGCYDYRGPNWEESRKLALHRDNYTCCHCDSKEHIDVHHIIPYSVFDSYIEANKIENLISLCNKCHTKEDWKYRKEHPEFVTYKKICYRTHICKQCGKEYKASNRSARSLYCEKCRIKICKKCGKEFRVKSFSESNKYCSRKCAGIEK